MYLSIFSLCAVSLYILLSRAFSSHCLFFSSARAVHFISVICQSLNTFSLHSFLSPPFSLTFSIASSTKVVNALRSKELSAIRSTLFLRAFNMGFFFVSTHLKSFFSFLTYELLGNQLTAEKVNDDMSVHACMQESVTLLSYRSPRQFACLNVCVLCKAA